MPNTTNETINRIAENAAYASVGMDRRCITGAIRSAILEATEPLRQELALQTDLVSRLQQDQLYNAEITRNKEQELAELRKDKERLDWLSTKALYHSVPSFWYNNVKQTLREAIDAAMGKATP